MLEVQEIEAFYGEVQALHKVSIRIEEGEMVGLVGANGAGKSTMLKVISGMMKPASGMIKFEDRVISGLPSHKVVELGVAHVPEGRRLFPLMTVEENLEMGSYLPLQTVDRAYVLENGKIVMEGKGTDLLENDHLKTAYLGL